MRVRRLNELEHQVLPSPLNPAHGRPRTRTCPHSTLYLNPHSTCRFAHFKGSHFPTSACNNMIHCNMLTFLLLILTSSDTGDWCGDITYTPCQSPHDPTHKFVMLLILSEGVVFKLVPVSANSVLHLQLQLRMQSKSADFEWNKYRTAPGRVAG